MPLEGFDYVLIALAAAAAGAVNALAGGGTLITFPTLTALGVPPVTANVTNTVALGPGYLGAMLAQRADLMGQRRRLLLLLPAAALGGLTGGLLLLNTGERLFRELVPYLILMASLLLAVQEPLRRRLIARAERDGGHQPAEWWATVPVFLAAIYGGYFGAGISVIVLAVLGLTLDDSLTRLNALKHAVTLSANVAATALFLFSGQVLWAAAVVMAISALIGGALGGRLAHRVRPASLRAVVVTLGILIAIVYFIRG
jgi:uncharacterized membrane protein YfcA